MHRLWIIALLVLASTAASAQFKAEARDLDMGDALTSPRPSLSLGWLDPSRFEMHHSFSSSFIGGGGNSMMLNSYTNTILYRFSDPLTMRLNLGLMSTPYNTFLDNTPGVNTTRFFGSAELFYKPTENTRVHFGVGVYPGYSPLLNPGGLRR